MRGHIIRARTRHSTYLGKILDPRNNIACERSYWSTWGRRESTLTIRFRYLHASARTFPDARHAKRICQV